MLLDTSLSCAIVRFRVLTRVGIDPGLIMPVAPFRAFRNSLNVGVKGDVRMRPHRQWICQVLQDRPPSHTPIMTNSNAFGFANSLTPQAAGPPNVKRT